MSDVLGECKSSEFANRAKPNLFDCQPVAAIAERWSRLPLFSKYLQITLLF